MLALVARWVRPMNACSLAIEIIFILFSSSTSSSSSWFKARVSEMADMGKCFVCLRVMGGKEYCYCNALHIGHKNSLPSVDTPTPPQDTRNAYPYVITNTLPHHQSAYSTSTPVYNDIREKVALLISNKDVGTLYFLCGVRFKKQILALWQKTRGRVRCNGSYFWYNRRF